VAEAPYDDIGWTGTTNLYVSDNAYQSITSSAFDTGVISNRARVNQFGFAIPSVGMTILGVKVEIEHKCTAGSAVYELLQLSTGGSRVGTNKGGALALPASEGFTVYGGPTDLWGATLTAAQINSTDFGVDYAVKATADNTDVYIDTVRITVYYEAEYVPPWEYTTGLWARGSAFTVTDDAGAGKIIAENNVSKCVWNYKALPAENSNRSGGAVYELYDKTNDPDCANNLVQVWDTGAGSDGWSPSRAGLGGLGTTKALVNVDTTSHSQAISENGSKGVYVSHSATGTDPVVATFVFDVKDSVAGRGWTHYRVTKVWTLTKTGSLTLSITYAWVGHAETVHNDGILSNVATSVLFHAGDGDKLAAAPTDHGNYHWAALLEHDGEVIWLVGAGGNVNGLDGRTATNTFTISRGYGGTTPVAHADDSAWTVLGEYVDDPNINFMVSRDYGYETLGWYGHDWTEAVCPGQGADGWNSINNAWVQIGAGIGNTGPEYHTDATGAWEDYGTKHVQKYRAASGDMMRALDIDAKPAAGGYCSAGLFHTGYDLWRAVGDSIDQALRQITGEVSTYRTTASYGHAMRFGSWFSSDGDVTRFIPMPYGTTWTDTYVLTLYGMSVPTAESNPLFDGTLSIKVAGVEYAALAGACQYETVAPGGFGGASFEVYPDDPFSVPAAFPELVNEAAVVVKHGAVILYEGHIVGDPTVAKLENGESLVAVECGGLLDAAKYRQDYGQTWVDTTYDNWARHRLSDKGFADTIDGKLRFDVSEGQYFTAGDIAGVFYRVNEGVVASPDDAVFALDFEYDLLLAATNWHCDIWAASYYVDTLSDADWTTGLWPQSNTTAEGTAHVTGFPPETRCIAFVNWNSSTSTAAAKRHAEITDLRVNCVSDSATYQVSLADVMVAAGMVTGLATSFDVDAIGAPLKQCVIPPPTTRADALDKLASMHEAPVDWGFWDSATLRVKKRLNSPADNVAIRALAGAGTAPAAYLLDAATPAIDYDVHKHEEGRVDYVRAIYSQARTNRVDKPNPSGDTWPADWARNTTTNTYAVADEYEFAFNATSRVPNAQTPLAASLTKAVRTGDRMELQGEFKATVSGASGGITIDWYLRVYNAAGTWLADELLYTDDWAPGGTGGYFIAFRNKSLKIATANAAYGCLYIAGSQTGTNNATYYTFRNVDWHDAYPGGMLRTVCAPSEPAADANLKVGILDLTGRGNMTVDRAFATATQALAWIDSTMETGTITVFSPTVPIYGGGTKLAAYVRATDWVECAQVAGHKPLWISSSHVDVDAGVTTLTIEPYPFDVAESDFGHAHLRRLRRWKKARRAMYRRQKAAIRRAQAKENKIKLGKGHRHRIHYT
jgi:hypothetical protein